MSIVEIPGIHDLPAKVYHSDPCPAPSLSSSIATTLLERSPRHAWQAHPRLNPYKSREEKRIYDIGTAAHALLLEGRQVVQVIDAADWRTSAAKEAREEAYTAGKVPLLPHEHAEVQAMVAAARSQLDMHADAGPTIFAAGEGLPEQTLAWREPHDAPRDGQYVWCRALVDWLPSDGSQILWDYKTTGGSAHPDVWTRNQLWGLGKDIQPAHYMRGAEIALGWDRPEFRFVVQEQKPPFALSVIALTPGGLDLARRRWREALDIWTECLLADRWPGYPSMTAHCEASVGAEWRHAEHEMRRLAAVDRGNTYSRELLEWSEPERKAAE